MFESRNIADITSIMTTFRESDDIQAQGINGGVSGQVPDMTHAELWVMFYHVTADTSLRSQRRVKYE